MFPHFEKPFRNSLANFDVPTDPGSSNKCNPDHKINTITISNDKNIKIKGKFTLCAQATNISFFLAKIPRNEASNYVTMGLQLFLFLLQCKRGER